MFFNADARGALANVAATKPFVEHLQLAAYGEGPGQEIMVGQEEQSPPREKRETRLHVRLARKVHGAAVGRKKPRRDLEQRRLTDSVAAEEDAQLTAHAAQRRRGEHPATVE